MNTSFNHSWSATVKHSKDQTLKHVSIKIMCRSEFVCLSLGVRLCVCAMLSGRACLGEARLHSGRRACASRLRSTVRCCPEKRERLSARGNSGTGSGASGLGVRGEGTGGVPRMACVRVCTSVTSRLVPASRVLVAPLRLNGVTVRRLAPFLVSHPRDSEPRSAFQANMTHDQYQDEGCSQLDISLLINLIIVPRILTL